MDYTTPAILCSYYVASLYGDAVGFRSCVDPADPNHVCDFTNDTTDNNRT